MTAAPAAARTAVPRLRWQLAEVVDVRPETSLASRLRLRPPHWDGHLPGQHLDVRLTAPDGYTATRSYSIASAPEQPDLELVVERLPGGEVSPYLTEQLRPGDELELRGPLGRWFVWEVGLGGPVQLLSGGSGVVPFLAMLEHHAAHRVTPRGGADAPGGGAVEVRLLQSARTLPDVIARERLAELAAAPGVRVDTVLTRAAPPGWPGRVGRLDRDGLREHVLPPSAEAQVFVCGPSGFVEALTSALVDLGHVPDRIKTERFGASGGPP